MYKLLQEQEGSINNDIQSLIDGTDLSNAERSLQGSPSCNPNNTEKCKGPERPTFTSKFNDAIQENPDIQAVQQVVDTSELEFYDCDSKAIFATTLAVELEGDYGYLESSGEPPDRETLDQIKVLERGVKKAYNTINAANQESCDTTFRRMRTVRFTGNVEEIGDSEFDMTFDIEWECYGCSGDLFDSGVSRETFNVDFREQGPIEPLCACAVGASILRAPTEEEFLTSLDITLEVRRRKGSVPFDFVTGTRPPPPPDDGSPPPPPPPPTPPPSPPPPPPTRRPTQQPTKAPPPPPPLPSTMPPPP